MLNKKKALGAIMEGFNAKKPAVEVEIETEGEGESDEGLKAAADDILSALSSKAPGMLAQALKDFVSMC